MRTITAAQANVVYNGTQNLVQAEFVRVSVKDQGGTFRDLTTYPGFNAIKSVHWSEKIEDPHPTFDVTVLREQYRLNLSPFVYGSALNKGFDPAGSNILLALNREVKIEVAIMPMDKQPSGSDWMEVFRGRIDNLDVGHAEEVSFGGRGLSGRLAQQYIKTEYVYSYATVAGLPVRLRVWEPNMAVTTADYVLPASRGDSDPGLNKFLKCSLAGTTGTTEPAWTTGAGQVDGTAHWDYVGAPTTGGTNVESVMQNILDDNKLSGDPTVTLYTPASPGWAIRQFIQDRGFTLDAVRALASQIGWDLRYKWRSGTGQFELTLYQPNRAFDPFFDSPDFSFGAWQFGDPTKMAVDIANIRNAWRIIYSDRADLWPDGTPKRKTIDVSDSSSIALYGELWAEISEDEASNIDSSTEANALVNAALSDCKDPTAEVAIPLVNGFPWVELNDMYSFSGDGRRFDTQFILAVTGYNHSFENGKMKTSLECRGLPTSGAKVHIDKTNHPEKPVKTKYGTGGSHRMQQFQAPKTPKANFFDSVGGTRVQLDIGTADKKALLAEYEIHVGTSSGFTPDSTTIKGVTKSMSMEMGDLIPGSTNYLKTVPRYWNAGRVVRGQPSAAQSFVAGRASAGHINSGIAIGDYPLNGGFETHLDANSLPDHWSIYTGVLNTNIFVMTDGNGLSGTRYIRLANGGIRSAVYPIIQRAMESSRHGSLYRFSWWIKPGASASGTYSALIRILDASGSEIDILTVSSTIAIVHAGHWTNYDFFLNLKEGDPTGRSLQLLLSGGSTSANAYIDIDEVRCQHLGTPWYEVGDTTYFTENYESIPGFANSWVADVGVPAFRKDQFGRVWLKGSVKNGTIGAACFTLPVGFRPAAQRRYCAQTGFGGSAELQVNTNGTVIIASGGTNAQAWTSLDGVTFMTTDVSTGLL